MKKCVPFIFKSKSSLKSIAQLQVKSRVITWQVANKSQVNKSATRVRLESSRTDSNLQLWYACMHACMHVCMYKGLIAVFVSAAI